MPTTIINASAGSGKTYRLAVTYLKALVTPLRDGTLPLPQQVLATTFTRAAASEILERVLERLAKAVIYEAEYLALLGEIERPDLRREDFAALLTSVCRALPMLQIGTIDALFARVVRVMGLDLAFPPAWTMADDTQAGELALAAADRMLRGPRVRDSLGQWRRFSEFKSSLQLRSGLVRLLEERRFLLFDAALAADDPALADPLRLEAEEAQRLGDAVRALEIPLTKTGMPNKAWQNAFRALDEHVRSELTLVALLRGNSLMKLLPHPESTYYSRPLPERLREILAPVVARARDDMHRVYRARLPALGALVRTYHDFRHAIAYATAAYRFSEIESAARVLPTHLSEDDLYFRLDGRVQHLLLDEFQDTSLSQFRFLWKIIDEIRANDRLFFAVGDAKQSIYGWRGADRDLLAHLPGWLGGEIVTENLDQNWRSSPAVLEAVNRIFGQLDRLPCLDPAKYKKADTSEEARVHREAATSFISGYRDHFAAPKNANLAGRVRLLIAGSLGADADEEGETAGADEIDTILSATEEHWRADEKRGIAILLRRGKWIPTIIAGLRRCGIEASGEGGNSVSDSAAVELVLSMLTHLDHPGHSLAREHVRLSGLAHAFGFDDRTRDSFLRARKDILRAGLAPVIADWIRHADFSRRCTGHDQVRCEQLVELARHWDSAGGGRLAAFVERVRAQRVDSPLSSRVRVMTIHGAKGLEFDAVILADLQARRGNNRGPELVVTATGPDTPPLIQLLPPVGDVDWLEMRPVYEQHQRNKFKEDLSVLYVALTRAKSFLDVVVAEPKQMNPSLVDIVCDSWGERAPGVYVVTERAGCAAVKALDAMGDDPAIWQRGAPLDMVRFEAAPDRLAAVTPSGQEGSVGKIKLGQILRAENTQALERGTAVHALLSRIEWSHDLPALDAWVGSIPASEADPAACRIAARELHPRFRLQGDALNSVFDHDLWLARWGNDGVKLLKVWSERRFAVIVDHHLMNGSFDRVVLGCDELGFPLRAEILDFKTDRVATDAEREERSLHYQPQLDAYIRALEQLTALPRAAIHARLVWVNPI